MSLWQRSTTAGKHRKTNPVVFLKLSRLGRLHIHRQLSLPQNSSSPEGSKFSRFLFQLILLRFVMFLQSPRYLHQTFHPPRPLANFASSLCSTGARLRLQSLEVWRCCHSESEIALVRVHVWLKKQQSHYLRRRRAGGRKQGNRTNWIGVLLKLETVNSIPLQAAATGRSWDHGKKEKLCVPPQFWLGPEQVPPVAGADP